MCRLALTVAGRQRGETEVPIAVWTCVWRGCLAIIIERGVLDLSGYQAAVVNYGNSIRWGVDGTKDGLEQGGCEGVYFAGVYAQQHLVHVDDDCDAVGSVGSRLSP